MKNVKLRLDCFLSFGLMCVEGDKLGHIEGCDSKIDGYAVCAFNERNAPFNEGYFVTSFAPRKNTGSQPVGDNVPVIILNHDDLCSLHAIARDIQWGFTFQWKPDLTALIKMQIEHDAKIDEETKIEFTKSNKRQLSAAEIFSKAGPTCQEAVKALSNLSKAIGNSSNKKEQKKFDIGTVIDSSYCKRRESLTAAADKILNHAIKKTELASGSPFSKIAAVASECVKSATDYVSIQQPKQGDKRRIEYCSNNSGQIEVEPVTFMFDTNKEICCLDSEGLMLVVDIEEFIAWHPVVSELEMAKKKQRDSVVQDIHSAMFDIKSDTVQDLAKMLQERGHLAEIILPLEK